MTVTSNRLITVVAVLHNDEAVVEPFVAAAQAQLAELSADTELILVDDNSGDRTADRAMGLLAKRGGLRVIQLSRTYGFDVAASAGIDASLGDCVIVMHPRHDPVELIPWLARKSLAEGRILLGRMSGVERRLGARLLRGFVKRLVGRRASAELVEGFATFIALPRQAVVAITRERFRIRSLPSITHSIGFPRELFTYSCAPGAKAGRDAGSMNRLITYMISNNILPLRVSTYAGLLACGLNLLYGVYIALANIIKGRVAEGWTTLSFQVNGLFLLVFIILVIQSEYLGVILQESKEAPSYHVLDDRKSSTLWMQPDRRNVVVNSVESSGADAGEKADANPF
jgi:polyisoprenyl-phosphate glycosyltransferase